MHTKLKRLFLILSILSLSIINSCTGFEYLAGSSASGLVDGKAIDARFDSPTYMEVDDEGNLYVIDQTSESYGVSGKVIRKITPDGKVSTFIRPNIENSITAIAINANYLYFSSRGLAIKKVNLKGDINIENVVGDDSEKASNDLNKVSFHTAQGTTGKYNTQGISSGYGYYGDKEIDNNTVNEIKDVLGSFEEARFLGISSMDFDKEGNLFVLDYNKVKKIDLKNSLVTLIRNDANFELPSKSSALKINEKSNLAYFRVSSSFYDSILLIDEKNSIKQKETGVLSESFDFDDEGNLYYVSFSNDSLARVSTNGEYEKISSLRGVISITKSNLKGFRNIFGPSTYLTIDKKRNILYLSSSESKIYKFNLKR